MHTRHNISSIIGLKGSIHEFFSLIQQNLDAFDQNPENLEHIHTCRTYIHQLNGLFEMLGLKDIYTVNGKIEQLIIALIEKQMHPDSAIINTIKQSAKTTLDYLDDLIDGAEENLLRLFPIYRDLMLLLGHEQISVYDLFQPDLIANPPLKSALADLTSQQLETLTKQARTEYQSGLAQWLKSAASPDNLDKMRRAITQIEKLPGPVEQRTFWWIAGGFLESLAIQQPDADPLNRKLCGKIEKTLRHYSVDELSPGAAQLTRELLYQIARQPKVDAKNQQIADICKAYALPALVKSDESDLPIPVSPRDYLQEIQKTLSRINENWQSFCSGEQTALDTFVNNLAQLDEPASQTQSKPLQALITAISGAAQTLQARQTSPATIRDDVTMEIATALLHLESIIVNFNKRQDNLAALVDTIARRLNTITALNQVPEDIQDATAVPTVSMIENPAQNIAIQSQAATEMLVNLQQIEHALEHFFQTPIDPSALSALTPLFNQISGVLVMLDLESANYLLTLCHNQTQKFADPDYSWNQAEQNLLVDGIGSLNFFLEALKHDTPDCQKIIDQAIAVFESSRKQIDSHVLPQTEETEITDIAFPDAEAKDSLVISSESEDDAMPAVRIDSSPDAELLNIFLEESNEILTEIAQAIQHCQTDNTDIKSLTSIRRGFHTLKGSSRMIKLEFFSDAAWMIEQVLNQWLNEKNPVTAALIGLLEYAHSTFTLWCSNLKSTAKTEIDTENLRDRINALHADSSEELLAAVRDECASEATEKIVTIGEISIETDLFEIFVKESKQHVITLEKELEALFKVHPATIDKPFTLAAHTLASISGALRLVFIAEPCSALEEWLSRLQASQVQLKEPDIQLIQNCVQQLGELLQKVYLQQFPDEIDLQLSQFLALEIKKRLYEKEASVSEQAIDAQQPIDLSEYRLKKAPAYTQSAQSDTHEHSENNFAADSTCANTSNELLHVFLEEARDTIPRISEKIRAWRILPQNDEIRINLLRLLHTLKGSANMIGAEQLGELIHAMESEVEAAFSEPVVSTYAIDSIEYTFDQLCEKIEQLQHTTFSIKSPPAIVIAADNASPIETPLVTEKEAVDEAAVDAAVPISGPTGTAPQESIVQPGTALRVNVELIDRLVNDSGEVSIIRSKIETQLNNFKQSLQDLNESIERLYGQLREIEIQAETQMQSQIAQQQSHEQSFDPLEFDRFTRFQELTRLMAESVDDVMTVQKNLTGAHNVAIEGVSQQAVIVRQLQQELVRVRMIPFGSSAERYYRVARKTAGELEKKINLTVRGEDVEIDRGILEKVSISLEHILRNAIVHGIEKPTRRIKSGKPEAGQIAIDLQREGNEVVISVSDDGIGLDLKRIYKKAIQLGLIHKSERLDDDQIAALIFLPGLTTRAQITGTAGRGMGMDIVHNDISGLGGQIAIDSQKNKGTVFHIRLPLTLAVAQTLMVSAGNQIFAIPSQNIAHIDELDWEALQAAYQSHRIDFDGHAYPFTHLSFLLSQNNLRFEQKKRNPVLLLQSRNLYLAVQVDALMGNQEVVVKNTGPQISQAPGIEGATLSGDGLPVLILNPLKLLQRADVQKVLATPFAELMEQSVQKEDTSTVVLVVDDSLTVRKATSRLLEREGFCVLTAKNGLEATEIMAHNKPDIILADLEMPKMNGFELIEKIRQNPDTAHVPIIVISSRTAEKHREMASQLGANFFIGKPYKEEELLERMHYYLQPGQASFTSRA